MAYYRVEGEIKEYFEHYVQAKSKKEAIEKAEELESDLITGVRADRCSKKDYEEYKTD